jgi:translation initiation factor 2B subunit (eIF-2B alpha/beta/delta family)
MLKFSLVLVLLSMTSLAQARDVSALQVGVEYARENLEKAEAENKSNLQKVSASEKRLEEAQKTLAEDRQKAEVSKNNLDEFKAKYEKAQQVLDQAWKQP